MFENTCVTFFNSDSTLSFLVLLPNITNFFSKIHLAVSLKEQELFPHPTYHRRRPTLDENSSQANKTALGLIICNYHIYIKNDDGGQKLF